jgi:hypothetical protein
LTAVAWTWANVIGAVVERYGHVAERVRAPRVRVSIRAELHGVDLDAALQPVQVHTAQVEVVHPARLLGNGLHRPIAQQHVDD